MVERTSSAPTQNPDILPEAKVAYDALMKGERLNGVDRERLGVFAGGLEEMDKLKTVDERRAFSNALFNGPNGALWMRLASNGESDGAKRYVVHTLSEALEPQPPLSYVVQDLFSAGSVSLIVGEPGSGKTYATLDCGVSVACEPAWLGHTIYGCPVLLVDEESGPRRLQLRLGEVARGHNADPETPFYWISLARFDLWNQTDADALRSAVEETQAGLVIIDALADVMPGRDENSVKDVQPIFMALRSIAEQTQAAIVVIHHNNKGGGYRGSTAIKGAVDLMLSVTKSGNALSFRSEKARDVDSLDFAALMNWGDGIFNLSQIYTSGPRPALTKSQRYVIRYLKEHGPSPLQDIMERADVCAPGTARNAVYGLTEKGYCQRTDEGGQGAPAMYALTDRGEELEGE